ncbi:MAG: M20/M25/M40 family metallo-hydrolase [Armatimonadetes bacterium]|nr:M20/M25/M40 family metallo-hydrolase [Armatimonadota bacterium]
MRSESICQYIDANRDAIVHTLQELVRTKTTNPYCGDKDPGGEAAGQEVLREMVESFADGIDLFDCPDDIYRRMEVLGPRERDFAGRPNLVATFSFGDGPTVVVNGHMDTVGIDNMDIDPLAATVSDGRVWGRGASDCKGGLTAAVWAIRALREAGGELAGRVILESVVDEECNGSGAGTLACIDRGYSGDVAVFVDGHDGAVTRGCYGCLTAQVIVEGQEGHAAYGTGVSAIEKGLIVKAGIDQFKAKREEKYPDARVNLGVFRAGTHPAVVPGEALMQLNIVYRLEDARASLAAGHAWGAAVLREEFEGAITGAASGDEWLREHPPIVEWVKDLVPFEEQPDNPWLARLRDSYVAVVGQAPRVDVMLGWTDAAYYSALAKVPTFLIGPAAQGKAHSTDEYVEIEALLRATKTLSLFLADVLSQR